MRTTQLRTKRQRHRHTHHDAPDTAADFQALARLPSGPEKDRIRDEVIAVWLPMAHRLAAKYRNRGESTEDLEQVAALGLVKAVERFDPEQSKAFESFATPTITGEIKRHFRDHMWDLHVPRRVQILRNKVRASVRELSVRLDDRSPTVAELAEHSGLPPEDVRAGLEAIHGFNSLSLEADMPGTGDGFSLLSTLGSEETGYEHVVNREAVRTCLCHLSEREQRILYLRFFHEMTQSAIAEEFGISQMHVSRLITGACHRIREQVDTDLHEAQGYGADRAA